MDVTGECEKIGETLKPLHIHFPETKAWDDFLKIQNSRNLGIQSDLIHEITFKHRDSLEVNILGGIKNTTILAPFGARKTRG